MSRKLMSFVPLHRGIEKRQKIKVAKCYNPMSDFSPEMIKIT